MDKDSKLHDSVHSLRNDYWKIYDNLETTIAGSDEYHRWIRNMNIYYEKEFARLNKLSEIIKSCEKSSFYDALDEVIVTFKKMCSDNFIVYNDSIYTLIVESSDMLNEFESMSLSLGRFKEQFKRFEKAIVEADVCDLTYWPETMRTICTALQDSLLNCLDIFDSYCEYKLRCMYTKAVKAEYGEQK